MPEKTEKVTVLEEENSQILKEGERKHFKPPIEARSIPKEKIDRGPNLDRREATRTFSSGIYKGITKNGEHEFVGKKKGNGRHIYHFFLRKIQR